ncbi:MAG: hypothetical protein M0036_22410 [Desulfobacteraceae bacterium]|nr:hypothetical protein [Desulfobacteraceae bacterium]
MIQRSNIGRDEPDIRAQQRLRMKRHAMAMATYIIVIISLFVTNTFGFGRLSPLHWWLIIGLSISGNIVFFVLIVSNWNLRLPDPSLTWWQILYAGLVIVVILYAVPNMRPTMLLFFIPSFSFGMLRLPRRDYLSLVAWVMGFYSLLLMVEYLQGRPDFNVMYELFLYIVFGIVLTWFAFFGGFISNIRRRLKIQAEAIQKAHAEIQLEMEERKKAQIEKDQVILELKEALSKVKTLSGLLPICASCKKIRDDKGYWNQLESYITHHTDAAFTHGICPECTKKTLADAGLSDPSK